MKKLTFLLLLLFSLSGYNAKANTPELTTSFNTVITNYLALKNALADDNNKLAQAKAATLVAALKNVSDKDMDAAQRKTWTGYVDKLSFDSRHISETTPIDHKREHFATLSTNLLLVLKAFKLNTVTLYKQYCPMKKNYWVSETASLKNPYYGSAMLTCGENKETLEAVK
jgi:hypothetical protein